MKKVNILVIIIIAFFFVLASCGSQRQIAQKSSHAINDQHYQYCNSEKHVEKTIDFQSSIFECDVPLNKVNDKVSQQLNNTMTRIYSKNKTLFKKYIMSEVLNINTDIIESGDGELDVYFTVHMHVVDNIFTLEDDEELAVKFDEEHFKKAIEDGMKKYKEKYNKDTTLQDNKDTISFDVHNFKESIRKEKELKEYKQK